MFDPKRAARVGAKRFRQREDYRLAKRQMQSEAYELEDDYDREHDPDSDLQDFSLNLRATANRKRYPK